MIYVLMCMFIFGDGHESGLHDVLDVIGVFWVYLMLRYELSKLLLVVMRGECELISLLLIDDEGDDYFLIHHIWRLNLYY